VSSSNVKPKDQATGAVPVLITMSKRYSADLSMSHLNLIGYWTGHP